MSIFKEEWIDKSQGEIIISDKYQYYHNHAREILEFNGQVILNFQDALNQTIPIKTKIRKRGKEEYNGIEADYLNKEIRSLLQKKFTDLKLEVNEQNGVYHFSTKTNKQIAGFDFALLNSKNNLIKLRNLCFGELKYSDGKRKWDKFLNDNPSLEDFSKTILKPESYGENIPLIESDDPLILGEIQFGNWGLVYRDFFKLLKANVQTSVDCLIYIVCAGELEEKLSDGIVSFDKTVKLLKEFSKVINVPVWVLGIDLKV